MRFSKELISYRKLHCIILNNMLYVYLYNRIDDSNLININYLVLIIGYISIIYIAYNNNAFRVIMQTAHV